MKISCLYSEWFLFKLGQCNCNDFFQQFHIWKRFSQQLFRKIFAILCVVSADLILLSCLDICVLLKLVHGLEYRNTLFKQLSNRHMFFELEKSGTMVHILCFEQKQNKTCCLDNLEPADDYVP